MASVTWIENGILRSARLNSNPEILGREAPATVVITSPDRTVSRRHARVTQLSDGSFRAENLSETNLTLVNGRRADGAQPLADGDTMLLGTMVVTFHDLSKSTVTSGLVCPTCKRDNPADGKDCWFDGTNLVNVTDSVSMRVRPAACRLLSPENTMSTLLLGNYLCIDTGGVVTVRQGRPSGGGCAAVIEVAQDNSATISGTAVINGAGLVSSRALREGDVVTVAGRSHLVLVS